MTPDHPTRPPGRDAFNGKGLLQRRFAVYDPSGAWVDVIQQIDPAPGFWGKYH